MRVCLEGLVGDFFAEYGHTLWDTDWSFIGRIGV